MLARLLDSVILIDHFNNVGPATDFLLGLDPNKTAISVISRAEILVGFDDKSLEQARSLLDQFVFLTIEKNVADETAVLRRKYGWTLPDAFQAALAIDYGIRLSTRNTKDFDPAKHAFVEIPYEIK